MDRPLLEIDAVEKRFGNFVAVKGVSLAVEAGETVGLLGVNGAGKTTLMNMILGLITPSGGSIRAFGLDITKHRIEILERTNFCTTYATLPGNLKVHHNLEVFASLYRVKKGKEKVAELLEVLEITHLADKITGRLSAGESTRVNLAKALLNNPQLLLLDEPTASLDPDIADKVRKLVRRIQRERHPAILYTSHNMRDIEEVCDRILFLHEGKILAEGTADEITKKFAGRDLDDVFIKIARKEIEALQA
ncbi:multidrug ABC transporter ATP-binding protein [Haloferula helveola]|uniref:Multidrug ABC transporter ATP-binding protein n=1 Tax=Haloferula helveola TaxID=490095 RepID=A0ABN6H8S6_9BACT|nr:multidrug ABC transporter ATP-binding protein [Haloferula helveola]